MSVQTSSGSPEPEMWKQRALMPSTLPACSATVRPDSCPVTVEISPRGSPGAGTSTGWQVQSASPSFSHPMPSSPSMMLAVLTTPSSVVWVVSIRLRPGAFHHSSSSLPPSSLGSPSTEYWAWNVWLRALVNSVARLMPPVSSPGPVTKVGVRDGRALVVVVTGRQHDGGHRAGDHDCRDTEFHPAAAAEEAHELATGAGGVKIEAGTSWS